MSEKLKMEFYIERPKLRKAVLTTRGKFNDYVESSFPVLQIDNPDEEVYMVEVPLVAKTTVVIGGGEEVEVPDAPMSKPNHPDYEGYLMVITKESFERLYMKVSLNTDKPPVQE